MSSNHLLASQLLQVCYFVIHLSCRIELYLHYGIKDSFLSLELSQKIQLSLVEIEMDHMMDSLVDQVQINSDQGSKYHFVFLRSVNV